MNKILDKIENQRHFDKIYDNIILITKNLNNIIKYQSETTNTLKEKITELEKKIHLLQSDV
tara:strand:- start:391 stop:573 length:183 start_codon:yes stop_codon:yes gene_type:complete